MVTEQPQLSHFIQLDDAYLGSLKERAHFYIEHQHLNRALMVLEMLHVLDEQDVLTQLLLAQTHLKMGYSLRAAAVVEPLVECHPEHSDAKVLLARIRIAEGEFGAASDLLKEVVNEDPQGDTFAGRRARAVAGEVVQT